MLHNSLFLVAHFHNVIIGAVLIGAMAGYYYWFPKAFGFTLDRRSPRNRQFLVLVDRLLSRVHAAVCSWAARRGPARMQHYADVSWQPYLIVAEIGAIVILCGIIATVVQLVVSIRTRESRRDRTGDPWNGRTLEWSTSSPPPAYNFAVLPRVDSLDAFWAMKQRGQVVPAQR